MGLLSSFKESTSGKNSTVLLSILSRIALMGIQGLAGDRILVIAGKPYYSQIERKRSNRQKRTSETAKKFLQELVATGFVVNRDRSPFETDQDIPKFVLTEKGRSKLVKLNEEFDRGRVK